LGGTPPLHHPCTSGGIPIGAQQHQPFSSFTSPLSTPIYNKTSHQPPHTPNLFTFKRVQTPLTQSTSRVQTQITYSLSRTQAQFMPQGFWPSYPQALAPYPIPGTVCTLPHPRSLVLYYISFKIQHDPACVLTMCGVQSSGLFFYFLCSFFSFFLFPVALRPTCVMLSRYISSLVAFDWMTLSAHSLSRVQT